MNKYNKKSENIFFNTSQLSQPIDFKEILSNTESIIVTDRLLKDSDIFNNRFFSNNLNVFQNINFHCNLAGLDAKDFIFLNSYEDLYDSHKNDKTQKINKKNLDELKLLLYLFVNDVYIFDNFNPINVIRNANDKSKDIIEESFSQNHLFYFSSRNINLNPLSEIFNTYVCIDSEEKQNVFTDHIAFSRYLEQYLDL